MTNADRELGAILARLAAIEQRLADAETDMRELTKTTTDLVRAVASLTARLSLVTTSAPPTVPTISAAGMGALLGAAAGAKLATAVFGV